jgi:hypothetical protein
MILSLPGTLKKDNLSKFSHLPTMQLDALDCSTRILLRASAEALTFGRIRTVVLSKSSVTSRNVKTKVELSSVLRKLPDCVHKLPPVDAGVVVYPFVFGPEIGRLYIGSTGAW